jgi:hypothetical protein
VQRVQTSLLASTPVKPRGVSGSSVRQQSLKARSQKFAVISEYIALFVKLLREFKNMYEKKN